LFPADGAVSIELTDIKKTFHADGAEPFTVLDGVTLTIPSGSSVGIIGRSGSGKSVTLKIITALLTSDAGSVRVKGVEVTTASRRELYDIRRRIGFLFQGAALFDSLNVLDNVGFSLREKGELPPAEIDAIVVERLEDVGLKPEVRFKMPADLSGGMKKRVALARVLAMNPEYVLYDEPTTGLDPITADAINDLIIETREKFGVTSIVVTHDMASAFKTADTIAMLYKGRVIETGTPEEILRTENPYVRQFVQGSSKGPIPILE
jgi:phospholipid/cholesterol/gamma-HCH transport system ATP-binding protein